MILVLRCALPLFQAEDGVLKFNVSDLMVLLRPFTTDMKTRSSLAFSLFLCTENAEQMEIWPLYEELSIPHPIPFAATKTETI